MQRHYCTAERTWLDFEGECSWCGMTEDEAKNYKGLNGDQLFEEVIYRISRHKNDGITDD